jgi:carboxymethylenebutenolidase
VIERVSFSSARGGIASGLLGTFKGAIQAPAVVVLQEYWGLNDHMRAVIQRWTDEGFIALAPDLYQGKVASTASEAKALMASLDWKQALSEIAGAVNYLRGLASGNGRVGVTGYCLGGALAFSTACSVRGLAAVVPYYGVPSSADWNTVDVPILAHFARDDDWASPEAAEEIMKTLRARGQSMELHVYDAKHAFCNDTRPEVYSPEHATLAWQRTVEFMRAHVG